MSPPASLNFWSVISATSSTESNTSATKRFATGESDETSIKKHKPQYQTLALKFFTTTKNPSVQQFCFCMNLLQLLCGYLDDFPIVSHQTIDLAFNVRRLRINARRNPPGF